MRLVRLLFIILFLLPVFDQPVAFGANEDLQSQDQITWYRAEFPPVTIPGGDNADTGFFDQAMYFLIEDLTQYHHQFRIANFKRIILEFKSGKNVCCPSLYKTKEREEFIAFSIPAMVVLPNGIIASEKSSIKLSKHIDENGKISLNSLLQDTDITLGISNGRIYSGGIDQIIQKFEGKSTILVRSGDDVFRGLMSMMYKGRVDVILGYPVEAEYFARKMMSTPPMFITL